MKLPEPVPSFVLLLVMEGFEVLLQHIPRAVTAEPPLLVILPPLVTEVEVTAETEVVVSADKTATVVVVISLAYAVPMLFVA